VESGLIARSLLRIAASRTEECKIKTDKIQTTDDLNNVRKDDKHPNIIESP